MHNILLGVNVDHIATIRQNRGTEYPDPVKIALEAEQAGADGITIHLREDRRHIQPRDVELMRQLLKTRMNLEMAVTEAMLKFAEKIKPQFCCFVPEKREELTTEGGLDVITQLQKVSKATQRLTQQGIHVSLFIDPDKEQIDAARACQAPYIEIHTGHYANTDSEPDKQQIELEKIKNAVLYAQQKGLIVNAGHGLNYQNVQAIAAIPGIHELNIGHAIVARAFFVGIREAVKEMKKLLLK